MTNSSCGIKCKWCWIWRRKKINKKIRLVCYSTYSHAHSKHRWLVIILILIEFFYLFSPFFFLCSCVYVKKFVSHSLSKLTFQTDCGLWAALFSSFFSQMDFIQLSSNSSGNISAFLLLLHKTDDSNCIRSSIQHIAATIFIIHSKAYSFVSSFGQSSTHFRCT